MVQHDFLRLSVNSPNDDFREFVDTLVAAVREVEKREGPMAHIHPVIIRETQLEAVDAEE